MAKSLDSLSCPICSSKPQRWVRHSTLQGEPRDAAICSNCAHGWLSEMENQDALEKLYEGLEDYAQVHPPQENLKQKLIGKSILSRTKDVGRLLDIGCGAGEFLYNFDQSWDLHGVELLERRAVAAQNAMPESIIHRKVIEECDFEDESFDVVTMFALIEHLVDPSQVVNQAARILKPGGLFVVMTGDRTSKKALKEGGNWYLYKPPEHFHFFSKDSIDICLKESNLFPIDHEWRFSFGYRTQIPLLRTLDRIGTLGFQGFCELVKPMRTLNWGDVLYVTAQKRN